MKENVLNNYRELALKTLNEDINNFYSFNELTYKKKENRFYLGKLDLHNGYGIILFDFLRSQFIMGYVYSDNDGKWYLKSLNDYSLKQFLDKRCYIGAVISQHIYKDVI